MSEATEYLTHWIESAAGRPPGMTRVTAQRSTRVRLSSERNTGIANYGLGVNGTVLKDSANRPIGLKFSMVYTWSDDRNADPADLQAVGQPLREAQFECEEHTLQITGDAVTLTVHSLSRPFGFSVSTRSLDGENQLVFSLPVAGRAAPQTRLVLSLVGAGEVRCGAAQLSSLSHSREWCVQSGAQRSTTAARLSA